MVMKTRTERHTTAKEAIEDIALMEEYGWAVRQIVPYLPPDGNVSFLFVVYEREKE